MVVLSDQLTGVELAVRRMVTGCLVVRGARQEVQRRVIRAVDRLGGRLMMMRIVGAREERVVGVLRVQFTAMVMAGQPVRVHLPLKPLAGGLLAGGDRGAFFVERGSRRRFAGICTGRRALVAAGLLVHLLVLLLLLLIATGTVRLFAAQLLSLLRRVPVRTVLVVHSVRIEIDVAVLRVVHRVVAAVRVRRTQLHDLSERIGCCGGVVIERIGDRARVLERVCRAHVVISGTDCGENTAARRRLV